MQYLMPIGIGVLYALLMTLVREPHRRRVNAVMVAGAGAAYLSGGGMGGWEFAFTALSTYVAYRGLDSWTFIGIGWLLHTAWDVVHHLKGSPLIPFVHDSSLGCAICDPVIALWCLRGGPSLRQWMRGGRGGADSDADADADADADTDADGGAVKGSGAGSGSGARRLA
ncbi:hypothetical protein GCM10010211_16980 [Streptomyces albospinus]|uniref:Integral membrane protein n=1 Tax=Streptomyces albospinus TaxID=285515 RepID=A0ABQ2UTG7_9ACTN|nr:DUF6010 family protein [Streptomyces albospinus]GGU52984.1 hypothetical protein GCM10010211_16980 [Streptomyces albospinus]